MALSEQKVLALKIDYELGKLSKTSICKIHKISRPTLRKHAKDGKWLYQKSFQEVSKEVEKRVVERLVEKNTDIVTDITDNFLRDSSNIRGITISLLDAMARNLETTDGNMAAAEANRLLTCHKVSEMASRTITSLYNATRKALGMDKDEDIRKAKEIKQSEQIKEVIDPLEGRTIEEVKEELEKLKSR